MTCEGTLEFSVSATDPEGDAITYGALFLPNGATFAPSTRTFSYTANACGKTFYVKFLATTASGGMDQILCKIDVGGLLSTRDAGDAEALNATRSGVVVGPNPTMGGFVFPALGTLGEESVARVYDMTGRCVATSRGSRGAPAVWNGRGTDGTRVAPGIYLYRVANGPKHVDGKIVVVR